MRFVSTFSYISSQKYYGLVDGELKSYPIGELNQILNRLPNCQYCFLSSDSDVLKAARVPNLDMKVYLKSTWDKLFLTKYLTDEEVMRFFTLYFNQYDDFSLEFDLLYQFEFAKTLSGWAAYKPVTAQMYAYPTDVFKFLLWLYQQEIVLPASNMVRQHAMKLNEIQITNQLDLSQFISIDSGNFEQLQKMPELAEFNLNTRRAVVSYDFSMAEWCKIAAKLPNCDLPATLFQYQDTCSITKLLPKGMLEPTKLMGLVQFWRFALYLDYLQANYAKEDVKLAHRMMYELISLWYKETQPTITDFTLTHYYSKDNQQAGFLLSEGLLLSSVKAKKGGGFGSRKG